MISDMLASSTVREGAPDLRKRRYAGVHVVADFWGAVRIETAEDLRLMLQEGAQAAGAHPLQYAVQAFDPEGLTGAVILAESHITVHTWPEWEYVAIDAFTCGATDPRKAIAYFEQRLAPARMEMRTIRRGKSR